jgi:signal transduction histidine kinase
VNGKDILIVEDETIVALDMKMRLESLGYNVVEVVDNGASALSFLAGFRPDLVLMDIKLKGGSDGIETARLARERVEVPIIFVTAFTDEATLERAKLASPYGYIVKPFHERELRIGIELALYKFQYELSMRRSKELAEEANRLKSEFLANVSHELKTPLNSVIGFTELSLDKATDEEQRDYLATVLRSARSLVTLIDSVLDFARLEKNSLLPDMAPFSIDELLEECASFLAVAAKSKGLEARFRRGRELPEFLTSDRGRIKQILMNLVDNAVKFTERGFVKLSADLAAAKEGGEGAGLRLRLVVEDSGIGIPEEKISKAMELFTQLDGSSTRQAGGTGLGLAIVSKSVELLGGTMAVASKPGEGSRFEVIVPVHPAGRESRPAIQIGICVVGYSPETRSDLAEVLALIGASSSTAPSLEAAAKKADCLVLADERTALASMPDVTALRGRLIVSCPPGLAGRADLAAEGCIVIPHPVMASSLLSAVASLGRHSSLGPATLARPAGPAPFERPREARGRDAEPPFPSNTRSPEFAHFIESLDAAIRLRDLGRAEQEAKDYRERFVSLEMEFAERLAFSTLLLARKGDWEGMEEILRKARGHQAPVDQNDVEGGKVDAFPGR